MAGGFNEWGGRERAAAAAGGELAVRHGPQHAANTRRALGPEWPRPPAQPPQTAGAARNTSMHTRCLHNQGQQQLLIDPPACTSALELPFTKCDAINDGM